MFAYVSIIGLSLLRINRQDTWIRKLNAWGWKMLVSLIFHIQVRDVDCAFKLYRADFFHRCNLETRGAMINTEILYKLKRLGYTSKRTARGNLWQGIAPLVSTEGGL